MPHASFGFRYRRQGASSWTQVNDIAADTLARVVTGLMPGTTYEAQVRAVDERGVPSPWSPSGFASTVTRIYDLRYRRVGASSWTTITDISGLSEVVEGLTADTEYEAQVRVRTTPDEDAPWSPSGSARTLATTPPEPPVIDVALAHTWRGKPWDKVWITKPGGTVTPITHAWVQLSEGATPTLIFGPRALDDLGLTLTPDTRSILCEWLARTDLTHWTITVGTANPAFALARHVLTATRTSFTFDSLNTDTAYYVDLVAVRSGEDLMAREVVSTLALPEVWDISADELFAALVGGDPPASIRPVAVDDPFVAAMGGLPQNATLRQDDPFPARVGGGITLALVQDDPFPARVGGGITLALVQDDPFVAAMSGGRASGGQWATPDNITVTETE